MSQPTANRTTKVGLHFTSKYYSSTSTDIRTSTQLHALTEFTIPSLLKHCASQLDLTHGQKLHTKTLQLGLQSDPFVASSLINMYFKCLSPENATNVFDQLPQRDTALWNSMVGGYLHCGRPDQALSSLSQMQSSGVRPDDHSLTILLKGCTTHHLALAHGEQIHCHIVRSQLGFDPILSTALVDMYSKCGDMGRAFRSFNGSVSKSVSMWNAMIAGFYREGMWEKSVELFVCMRKEGYEMETSTVSSVLMACVAGEEVDFGEGVHCCALKEGLDVDHYVSPSLLTMYGKFGLVDSARRVFNGVHDKRIELWNSMVSTCIGNGEPNKALDVYYKMRSNYVRDDTFTLSNVLSACTLTGLWDLGRRIHGGLIKKPESSNMAVKSSLMTMYMKSGSVDEALRLFELAKDKDLIVWGSMIAGFSENKRFHHALSLFSQMRAEGFLPDSAIVASVVSACAGLECLELGCQLHGHSIKSGMSRDQFVGSTLIDMYSKLRLPLLAGSLFTLMPYKNLVVFNSMIAGYSRNSLINECIHAFCEISLHGLVPNSISITSVLASVSSTAALLKGKMIHGYQLRKGIVCDIPVENALLDMYMKCGCSSYSQFIFDRMPDRNLVSWNTMIAGYGSHGHYEKAILLFEEMKRAEVMPDEITFLSLLSSCNHSGSLEEGELIFGSMRRDHDIVPRMEHFVIMVDILARAGKMGEAYSFIEAMPIEPDVSIWLCLLSACRAYRASHLGEVVADQILKLKPEGSGVYTQVLNFFGEMGLLEKAANVRVEMREARMKKSPGVSWIEVKDRVHMFYSGGSSSLLMKEIHATLSDLRRSMREANEFS